MRLTEQSGSKSQRILYSNWRIQLLLNSVKATLPSVARCNMTLCTVKRKKSFMLGSTEKFDRIVLHKATLPKGSNIRIR